MNYLDEKDTTEKIVISFDFTAGLGVAETLTGTPTVSASVYLGTDAAPSAVLSGSASIVGSTVLQAVTGGVRPVDYKLTATCTTSAGQILSVVAVLPVR